MTPSRTALSALAAIAALGLLAAPAPASATDWSWLANKQYIQCLQIMSINWSHRSPAQQAAAQENGRHICNMKYYGHP